MRLHLHYNSEYNRYENYHETHYPELTEEKPRSSDQLFLHQHRVRNGAGVRRLRP